MEGASTGAAHGPELGVLGPAVALHPASVPGAVILAPVRPDSTSRPVEPRPDTRRLPGRMGSIIGMAPELGLGGTTTLSYTVDMYPEGSVRHGSRFRGQVVLPTYTRVRWGVSEEQGGQE